MNRTSGFAVVDLETTGIHPGRYERVIEVGVVHVAPDGRIEGRWDTLLNPQRDLGPQHIHGITAAEIRHAPTFQQIAGKLADLLAGRVVVAHNLRFDAGFLTAEYGRIGVDVPLAHGGGICTMTLARTYLPGSGRSLADCCSAFGIANPHQHRALTDALAAAGLLGGYLNLDPRGAHWAEVLAYAAATSWPVLPSAGAPWFPRESVPDSESHFLTRLVEQLPDAGVPAGHADYLAMVDRALLDRHISATEADALVAVASELGIDQSTANRLHEGYLRALAQTAWADGVITSEERDDLRFVGVLLGVEVNKVDAIIAHEQIASQQGAVTAGSTPEFGKFELQNGDLVVLTGEMSRPRHEWEEAAIDCGLVVHPAVTKKVKVVVAADPDSLSGKARKARQYGIPVVTEDAFGQMLDRVAG